MLDPPANYQPIRTPARKLSSTPTPMGMSGFRIQMEDRSVKLLDEQPTGNMPFMKPEDMQYFDKLLVCDLSVVVSCVWLCFVLFLFEVSPGQERSTLSFIIHALSNVCSSLHLLLLLYPVQCTYTPSLCVRVRACVCLISCNCLC